MHKGKRFLAVIPARGGSKGLRHKNRRLLKGKPLVVYTIQQALAVPTIDCVLVSSDDEQIIRIAKKAGACAIKRPAALATDTARTEDALLHALEVMEANGDEYDFVVTLEPTHPLRSSATLKKAITMVVQRRYDSLLTLTPDRTDFWTQKRGRYRRLFPKAPRRRQDREPLYKENSLIYITSVSKLRKRHFVIGTKPAVLITQERESLDIHTEDDLRMAALWMKSR